MSEKKIEPCPACREAGTDKSGDHLAIFPSGKFACAIHPGDKAHNRRIVELRPDLGKDGTFPQAQSKRAISNPSASKKSKPGEIVAVYPYHDATGKLVYEIRRDDKKEFWPYLPGAEWPGLNGVVRVPYRLPEVIQSETVWIVEGEKDADCLASLGYTATSRAGGSGKWDEELTPWFAGKDVIFCGDNDKPGRDYFAKVEAAIKPVARSFRQVIVPGPAKDISEYIGDKSEHEAGSAVQELLSVPDPLDALLDARRFNLANPPAKPVAVLSINGKTIATAGNLVAVKHAPISMELLLSPAEATWAHLVRTDAELVQAAPDMELPKDGKYITWRNAAAMTARDLGVTSFASGGALTQTEIDKQVIEFLYPKSVLLKAGAKFKTNVALPRGIPSQEGTLLASWLAESAQAPLQDAVFGARLLNARRLTVNLKFSNLLGAQAAPDFEAFIVDAAVKALMEQLDAGIISGAGGVAPVGLLNLAGTGEVTFGGAPSLAKILAFENSLETSNVVDDGTFAWFVAPNTMTVLKQTLKTGNNTFYLADDSGRINGQKSFQTTELSATNQVIFCKASDIFIAALGNGFFLNRNPFTHADSGEVRITATMFCDAVASHAQSICISLDAGNQ